MGIYFWGKFLHYDNKKKSCAKATKDFLGVIFAKTHCTLRKTIKNDHI
jgi:hypothetical protein